MLVPIRPNKKKTPVFRVTRPYLNLLVKSIKKEKGILRFSGKYNFMHLERRNAFQNS